MGENMNQPEGSRLYIEGQPVEWDGNLPELEPLEEPEASESLERLAQAACEVCERILELSKIWSNTKNSFMDYMLCVVNDNPKWWHLYKHAKKRRTRKKYRNRLMRQLLSIQRAASAQEA